MAAGYAISTGIFAYTGTQGKTLCNVINAATGLVRLTELSVATNGTTASAVPGHFQLQKSTQAGAGTAGGSTINQIRGPTRTVQATAGTGYTAEPTTTTVVKAYYVPQYNGLLILQFPLGREPEQVTASNAIGSRFISTADVSVLATLDFEEG